MHDTTISSIKKLVLVCLVTIMKWLVTLDAGLPVVVSLMTSTPSSLSQTWSSYRLCRLEQHDNMANRTQKLNRISWQYSPKFQDNTLDVECWWSITHPAHIGALVVAGREWSDHCLQPPQASLNTTPSPPLCRKRRWSSHKWRKRVWSWHWLENISSSIHW